MDCRWRQSCTRHQTKDHQAIATDEHRHTQTPISTIGPWLSVSVRGKLMDIAELYIR